MDEKVVIPQAEDKRESDLKLLDDANRMIKAMDIKGKEYAPVNERIKAFRFIYPRGQIITELLSLENGVCTMKCSVYDDEGTLLATGHAQEKEGSSFINKTSFIENCETSCIGRAIGSLGLAIDGSFASYEEVSNAQLQQSEMQDNPQDEKQVKTQDTISKEEYEILKNEFNKDEIKNMLSELNVGRVSMMPRNYFLEQMKKKYPDKEYY